MDILATEDFIAWVEKQDWLFTGEVPTPFGRQDKYLTPAGNFVFALYDLAGKLTQLAFPIAQPPPTTGNVPRGFLNPPGGGRFPG